jgi:hypothetical protein
MVTLALLVQSKLRRSSWQCTADGIRRTDFLAPLSEPFSQLPAAAALWVYHVL